MQSYTDFLQSFLGGDRTKQEAYLDQMWKGSDVATADARLSDLTREQAAKVLAEATGMPQFNRFAENKFQRGMDYLGNFAQGMFTDVRPADYVTGASQQTAGEFMGNVGENVARGFGASDPKTLAGFRAAGEGVPATVGTLSTMLLGPVGVGAGLASMYGQGLNQAYEKGVTGAKATGIASIAPAIMLGTMAAAKPVASWIGGKLAGEAGVVAATEAGMKYPGSVALAEAMGSTATSFPKKVGMKLAQEAVVQSTFSAGNIAGNIATQVALDKDTFLNETIKSQEYWIPTLTNEILNGVGGSTIARVHDPIKTNATLVKENAARQAVVQQQARGDKALEAVRKASVTNPLVAESVLVEVIPPEGVTKVAPGHYEWTSVTGNKGSIKMKPSEDATALEAATKMVGKPTPPEAPGAVKPLNATEGGEAGAAVAGFGKGLMTGLYKGMFDRLQAGEYPEIYKTPTGDRVAEQHAKQPFQSADEIQQWVNAQPKAPATIFPPEIKVERAIDPVAPDSDKAVLDHETGKVSSNSVVENDALRAAANTGDGTLAVSPEIAVTVIANAHVGAGEAIVHQSPVRVGMDHVNAAVKDGHPDTDVGQMVVKMHSDALTRNKNHSIPTDATASGNGNHQLVFLNQPTAYASVMVHILREGDTPGDLVTLTRRDSDPKVPTKDVASLQIDGEKLLKIQRGEYTIAHANAESGVDLTPTEWGELVKIAQGFEQQILEAPAGVHFAEGSEAPEAHQKAIKGFFEDTGLLGYLVLTGKSVVFGRPAGKFTVADIHSNPMHYFSTRNRAQNAYLGNKVHYISEFDGLQDTMDRMESDLHEIGHVIHRSIEEGAFGTEHAAELEAWLKRVDADKSKKAPILGAKLKMDLTTEMKTIPSQAHPSVKNIFERLGMEDFDPQGDLEYLQTRNEVVAQTFQGVMLEKAISGKSTSKYASWVKDSFPKLYELFSQLVKSWSKHSERRDLYSPQYNEGRKIIEGILDAAWERHTVARRSGDALGILQKQGIADDSHLGQAFLHAYLRADADTRPALTMIIKRVTPDGFGPDDATTINDLSRTLQLSKRFGITSSLDGMFPPEENIRKLSAVQWLERVAAGQREKLGKFFDENATSPEERARLTEVYGTSEMYGYVAKLSKDQNAYRDAAERDSGDSGDALNVEAMEKARAFVSSSQRYAENAQQVLKWIGEKFAVKDPMERLEVQPTKYPEEVKGGANPEWQANPIIEQNYLFAIEDVVRQWMLGRLPGQEGRPMYDPQGKAKTKKGEKDFEVLFPIMEAEINKAFKALDKTPPDAFVKEDGTYVIPKNGEKPEGTKTRLAFDTIGEAREYINTLRKNSAHAFVELMPKPEPRTGKFYIRVRENKSGVGFASLNGLHDLVAAPEANNFTSLNAEMKVLARAAMEKAKGEVRAEIASKGGPTVMRRLSDVVPKMFNRISRMGPGNGFDAWSGKVNDFLKWFHDPTSDTTNYVGYLADLGLPADTHPIDFATTMVELKLLAHDSFKSTEHKSALAYALSDPKWADMSGAEVREFVQSAYSVAQDIAVQELHESAMVVDGMMPTVDPGEQGKGAVFDNDNIMLDGMVAKGANAVTRHIPGNAMGKPSTYAEDRHWITRAIGSTVGAINSIHAKYGQGAHMQALFHPEAAWAGEACGKEIHYSSAYAQQNNDPYTMHGEVVNDVFVPNGKLGIDKNNPVGKYMKNAVEDARINDIKRLENLAEMPFERILSEIPTNPEGIAAKAEAVKLRDGIPSAEWAATHHEYLARNRLAAKRRVENTIRQQTEQDIKELALSLDPLTRDKMSSADRDGLATRFYDGDRLAKYAILTEEAGMEPVQADKYITNIERTLAERDKLNARQLAATEWHTTESRMKPFQVRVVFKKGTKGVPEHGLFDFDTLEAAEAQRIAFQKLGHKVDREIIDITNETKRFRPVNSEFQKLVADRAKISSNWIESLLTYEGANIEPHIVEMITKEVTAIPDEVARANEMKSLSKQLNATQKLLAGRENLNMIVQAFKHGQRVPAAMQRRITDLTFELYKTDPKMMANPKLFKTLDEFRKGIRYKDTEAQQVIGHVGFGLTMMASVSTGVIEAGQAPITMAPHLVRHGATLIESQTLLFSLLTRGFKSSLSRIPKVGGAVDRSSIWAPFHAEFLQYAEDQGRMNQRKGHDIETAGRQEYLERYENQTSDIGKKPLVRGLAEMTFNALNGFYGMFNRFNAEICNIASFEIQMKKKFPSWLKMSEEKKTELLKTLAPHEYEAMKMKALDITDEANGSLQRLGRPGRFNTQMPWERGWASATWSLQSFVNAQIANQLRWLHTMIDPKGNYTKAERVQSAKALTMLMGMQVAAMGIGGLTMFPAINKLVSMTTGFDMDEEVRRFLYDPEATTDADKVFWSEFASNGFLSALGFPIDYGTRLGVAGMGPFSAYEGIDPKGLGGPLVGLSVQAMRDAKKMKEGSMEISEFGLNLLPVGLRRLVHNEYFNNGKVLDGNKKYMFEPTMWERIGMGAGFNTSRARKEMAARMQQTEGKMADSARKNQWTNETIKALNEKSVDKMQQLLEQGMREFGQSKTDLARHVADTATAKTFGQVFNEGSGPNAQRAAALYPRQMPKATNVARAQQTMNYMEQLGVRPNVSRNAMRQAYAMDNLLTQNPSLSTGFARNVLQNPANAVTVFGALNGPRGASSMPGFLQGLGLD